MKWIYKILRTLAVSLIALIFLIPAVLYVVLSLPSVNDMIAARAAAELTELFHMPVSIGHLSLTPFNRATLEDVTISDSLGRKAIEVERLGAGINLWQFFAHSRVVVDYAEVIGLDARLSRDSLGAPLNIQPLIDALSPKDKTKPPTRFDLRINMVVIRTSAVSYDLLSAPHKDHGFDPNHISISGLRADLQLPQLKNDDFIIDLRRLAFAEQSGMRLNNLSGYFHISDSELTVRNLVMQMPHSRLAVNDHQLTYNGFADLAPHLKSTPLDIVILPGSYLATSDIAPIVPRLEGVDMTFDIDAALNGTPNAVAVERLRLSSGNGFKISAAGSVNGLQESSGPNIDLSHLSVELNSGKALDLIGRFVKIDQNVTTVIGNLGDLKLTADGAGNPHEGHINADLTAEGIRIAATASFNRPGDKPATPVAASGDLHIENFDGSRLFAGINTPAAKLTALDADLKFDIKTATGALPDGSADLTLRSAVFNAIEFSDLTAEVSKKADDCEAHIFADNALLYADADVVASIGRGRKAIDLSAEVRDFDLALFMNGLAPGSRHLSLNADARFSGNSIDDLSGWLTLESLRYDRAGHDPFTLGELRFEALRSDDADSLLLQSEILDASVTGRFHLSSLVPMTKAIIAQTMPVFVGSKQQLQLADDNFWNKTTNRNVLSYNINVKSIEPLAPLVKIPVGMLQNVRIFGDLDSDTRSLTLNLDAPYLSQGNKLIENTSLMAAVRGLESEGDRGRGTLNFTTTLPTKNGPMTLIAGASAINDCIDTHLLWKIDRQRDFSGDISMTSCFLRDDDDGKLQTEIKINPSRAVFNDTVWTIDPATIAVHGKVIEVDRFRCWRDKQFITMNGRVSELPSDTLTLSLNDVNLDYVFETLDIPTAMFGGNVTGSIYATELLTPTPHAFTPSLEVKSLTYNYSLLGDAEISSGWNNVTKGIMLYADIHQPNGRKSTIDGAIYPLADSLNLKFDCDKIEIGFLRPYMSAFASNVSGYASGQARLYGTFKLIDMAGDVYGEDVSLTLGFTNTTYTTTDSVHFRPGRIDLDNLLLKDKFGQTARLNGWVTHECFKSPRFNFEISQARDLLVYDMPENKDFQWYGRVFGNGGARVTGAPGIVDISVDMTTARNSAFTYVLSDALSAQDYNFITFRDRDQARKDSIAAINAPPSFVREFRERMAQQNQNSAPSKYRMNFNIGITPQALITLVMDPVGGGRILAHGNGTLSMSYDSANEDLRMNGTYTLDDGKYNFTLQDIILKDFIIEPGSSIAFNGDPYAAQLNLTAKFQTKANLTDLDESFIDDKELNRTAVPVNALMAVKGDMRQPEISFDLDFPTLTEDPKRKIRSIINTEEMMNRQIIYLLALGRFYTPDYMNATRGNELVSVASSTISSQLSNILGQLSDNWNIAPNFRSDRGDFSDVEFDVALSSRLLDNRLLLNGNLGYRDKSLNNNSFIGDFDIEYLLNRSGSLRLKAYNRYNDQNYYLKSALTTQGVGLVFKRDFDSLTSWLRPMRRHLTKTTPDSLPQDSTNHPIQ